MAKLELFIIDTKTRLVELNKEWISTIKEFKALIKKDDSKNKIETTRKFTFIYHYCDYNSKFTNYPEKDKIKECLKNAELPEDTDPTKDIFFAQAIAKYISLQSSPALKFLYELREGIHTGHLLATKIRVNIETKLAELKFEEVDQELEGEGKKNNKNTPLLTKLMDSYNALVRLTTELPNQLDKIDELEEKVKKQLSDEELLRGGTNKGVREDRDSMPVPTMVEGKKEEKSIFSDI